MDHNDPLKVPTPTSWACTAVPHIHINHSRHWARQFNPSYSHSITFKMVIFMKFCPKTPQSQGEWWEASVGVLLLTLEVVDHMCGRLGWAIDDQKRYGTSWDITWPVHVHIWKVYFLTIKSRWMMGSKCRSAVIDVGGCRPYVWTTWMSYWWSETVWYIMRYHLAGTCPYMKSVLFDHKVKVNDGKQVSECCYWRWRL